MPKSKCLACGGTLHWNWEEAFDKFRFGDGASGYMTHEVVSALETAGYDVRSFSWGCHNDIIIEIAKDGRELMSPKVQRGYDNPRKYLPRKIVRFLDERFPREEVAS